MFRITHISDTHGMMPVVPKSSLIIVHSGDMAPNFTRGVREVEEKLQAEWWNNYVTDWCKRIGDAIFAFIPGNHDYFDPEPVLRRAGIKAYNLEGKRIELLGKTFYGFPYIPFIAGEWNYEVREPEMSDLVSKIPDCDILVTHCPPFGICADVEEGKGGGNSLLMNWLAYDAFERLPRYLLCGHFHESRGIGRFTYEYPEGLKLETIVSNAATVQHTFEVE